MGHLEDDARGTSFPVADIHWIGAVRIGSSAYAKGYIPRTHSEVREYYRVLQTTGGRAATSIYGWADREDLQGGQWRARTFELEQLDLAPQTRAAITPTSPFVITAEMQGGGNMEGDVATLTSELEQSRSLASDLRQQLADARRATQRTTIGRLVSESVNWSAATDKGKEALSAVRLLVAEQVAQRLGDDPAEEAVIRESVDGVLTSLKPVIELVIQGLTGPAAVIPGAGQTPALVDTPEAREKARAEFGF
jgi:hypothetical protein